MKTTLSTNDIANALCSDQHASWSWEGAKALAEYLEELEQDLGEEMELDVVALRCDYSEHGSLQEWAEEYFTQGIKDPELGIDDESDEDEIEDEIDDAIRDYIQDNGQLIEFNGGIIVSSF